MTVTNLTDNLLSNASYKSFKRLMEEQGAIFTATELEHETNAVELRGCCVEYGAPLHMMTMEERSTHDFDADWQHILKLCGQFGFQPK